MAALGGLLAVPPADPFARELVAVPTRGMERWLTQSLSSVLGTSEGRGDGVLANVAFPSPRALVDEAVALACGIDPAHDGWGRTLWPLLDVVDGALGEPWLSTLADHLRDSRGGDAEERPPRLVALQHLTQLYDRYALHRPGMLARWAAGEDVDAAGTPLTPGTAWQAELWRRLRERIVAPDPAARLRLACARIEKEPGLLELPERVALFGLTRLPGAHLSVLRAIAAGREVHLFALHPSPALWQNVESSVVRRGAVQTTTRRAEDPTSSLPANRLLASWGRDARELQLVLGGADHDHLVAPAAPQPATLLEHLQADVRADVRAPGPPADGERDERPLLAGEDRSVEVHACHGRARQVEVLRDVVLHALSADETLEPRDIIVLCPDIETFAPLIQASFGAGELEEAGTDLRVRLADRALRQTNPVLGTLARLLELADARLTSAQALDLADREPVRRRFGLDDDDLARLEDWTREAQIRWGLDGPHREPFKLADLTANTWRAGIDRVLLGVSMSEEEQALLGGVLPLDDVESGAVELAGRLAELVDRLASVVDRFAKSRPVGAWTEELATAADLLCAVGPQDAWQRGGLDRLLADLRESAAGSTAELELAEVRALLAGALAGRPTRANFRTGHLTFCTLSPMRSVPHRVVCLLGLDDDVFPRKAPRDGDDLILADPRVGDQDGRTEDRQMLLDALMAAEDRLVVTYTGNDERTNVALPPAVPIGELLDVVDRTVRAPAGTTRERVTTRHPLQPFDPRVFTPGALSTPGPFGHDTADLAGARALVGPRTDPPPFLPGPLQPPPGRTVELEALVRFVQHPARAFLQQRLGIRLSADEDDLPDALPIELDHLERWAVGDRMLRARRAGHALAATLAAERARGGLPPGALAAGELALLEEQVEAVAAAAERALGSGGALGSLDIRLPLPDGRALGGTVAGLDGDRLQLVTYSRVGPKHRLAAWVRLLALTAARPERPFSAVTIGRRRGDGSRRATVSLATIAPLGADAETRGRVAREQLAVLLDLHDRGLREPPPLACATSAAYAQTMRAGRTNLHPVRKAWESEWAFDHEDKELEHVQLLGGVLSLEQLLARPPSAEETAWGTEQPSRFGAWALRLWTGLLAHEELVDE